MTKYMDKDGFVHLYKFVQICTFKGNLHMIRKQDFCCCLKKWWHLPLFWSGQTIDTETSYKISENNIVSLPSERES